MVWYAKGLKFQCTGCGKCCTGPSGYVFLTVDEMQEIASRLNMELEEFTKQYVRQVGDRYALLEKKRGGEYDCIFLEGKRCSIYENRPKQCQTFPWWPSNLSSESSWQATSRECEGISDDAPLFTQEEIESNF